MKTKTINPEPFLSINYNLIGSTKFTSTEKIFFAYLIGWQVQDKICFESTNSIAKTLGINTHTFKKLITKCNNEYKFFISEYPTDTTHTLSIDIELLNEQLEENDTPTKKVKNISTQVKKQVVIEPTAEEVAMEDIEEEYEEVVNDEILPTVDWRTIGTTPTYAPSTIEEELSDEKETVILANGTVIPIMPEYLDIWKKVANDYEVVEELKNNRNQWLFEIELSKYED